MTTNLLSFGVGMALGGLIWGDNDSCDWDDHVVYGGGYGGRGDVNIQTGDINVNRGVVAGGDKGNRQPWQHSPEHRRGVGYKDPATRQRYASAQPARITPQQARGFDRAPGEARPAAATGKGAQGVQGRGGREQAAARPAARPEPKPAARPQTRPAAAPAVPPATAKRSRDDAFSGMQGGQFERQASARGAASRADVPQARSGGGGRPAGGTRGGGGGGGGRSGRSGGGGRAGGRGR